MVEFRCRLCGKLLFKWDGTNLTIEIICRHCGALNFLGVHKIIEAKE